MSQCWPWYFTVDPCEKVDHSVLVSRLVIVVSHVLLAACWTSDQWWLSAMSPPTLWGERKIECSWLNCVYRNCSEWYAVTGERTCSATSWWQAACKRGGVAAATERGQWHFVSTAVIMMSCPVVWMTFMSICFTSVLFGFAFVTLSWLTTCQLFALQGTRDLWQTRFLSEVWEYVDMIWCVSVVSAKSRDFRFAGTVSFHRH